jgi:4-carboxymuconolactone decarboxylase
MTIHDDDLGGRLRLRNPADLPAAQKQIYDRLNTGMIQWAETIPFRSTTSGGRLIGPYNPMLLSPTACCAALTFGFAREQQAQARARSPTRRPPLLLRLSQPLQWV